MLSFPALEGRVRPGAGGSRIGNYEVVRKLATGGMGEVFLAYQTGPLGFRRRVVLKKLHPRFTSNPRLVAMFLDEARISANLAHPNIVHVYELFESDQSYVIAMEYVRGGTVLSLLCGLEHRGARGLPLGPMVRIATSVAEALYHAYNDPDPDGIVRRVIHRDVTPSNVLVGYDGQVKLADFGIAKVLEDQGARRARTIQGKNGYLTPEQLRGEPLDQGNDVFSLGTMLWEMSVGRRLFQRDDDIEMMRAILEDAIPRPSAYVAGYPADLDRVVQRALARSRDDRYPDAHALAVDLRAVARAHGWDCERPALAQLVKDALPDDQIGLGRIGSQRLATASGPLLRRAITSGGADADSFAPVVIDSGSPGAAGLRETEWWTKALMVTIAVWLVLSGVFWLWIVPTIER
jgi:eukaryotic-like serine/threonine-protein kinase